MLLSVILCSHIAAGGLANESVCLLGRRRPEIRVASRSGCGGPLGVGHGGHPGLPAATAPARRAGRFPEGRKFPRSESPSPWPPGSVGCAGTARRSRHSRTQINGLWNR